MTPPARCVTVTIPPHGSVRDLLGGRPPDQVFTPAERRRGAERPGLASWAGRLAAKQAVLGLLDAGGRWTEVEVLPAATGLCADPEHCTGSHPPRVVLRGGLADRLAPEEAVAVSISHAGGVAVALAVRMASASRQ